MFHERIPLSLVFLLLCFSSSEFCEWVQVGIDVYIPHRKYQVKPHSSPWFSAAYAAAIVYREAGNHCKRVLEAARPKYMLVKQKICYNSTIE